MSLKTIESLLSQKIGISVEIIGSQKIARAVEIRRSTCGLGHLDAYIQVLQNSAQEFQELVEQIVVPETWFFRDQKPFDFLQELVRTQWLSKPHAKFRLLSAPCSTGEEPYSMAITLLEAGLAPDRFSVDAIDISQAAIEKAQRTLYTKNSFRGGDGIERNRYFQQTARGYEVVLPVRNLVNFKQGNIFSVFSGIQNKYDIIFCRNLLIYLKPDACSEVFNILEQLLVPHGLLFVGASETAKIPRERFQPIRQSFTFAYRKVQDSQSNPSGTETKALQFQQSSQKSDGKSYSPDIVEPFSPGIAQKTNRALKKSSSQPFPPTSFPNHQTDTPNTHPGFIPHQKNSKKTQEKIKQNSFSPTKSSTSTPENSPPLLPPSPISDTKDYWRMETARQLADSGQVEAAIDYCKEYLDGHSTSTEAYTLLGILYQAKLENTQAERYFQKALYLDPYCNEALIHLALLKEHRGDLTGAEILQQRLKGLQ